MSIKQGNWSALVVTFYTINFMVIKGLFNMCNIAYVKTSKSSNFSLKNNTYLLKRYIFNIKYTSSKSKLPL